MHVPRLIWEKLNKSLLCGDIVLRVLLPEHFGKMKNGAIVGGADVTTLRLRMLEQVNVRIAEVIQMNKLTLPYD